MKKIMYMLLLTSGIATISADYLTKIKLDNDTVSSMNVEESYPKLDLTEQGAGLLAEITEVKGGSIKKYYIEKVRPIDAYTCSLGTVINFNDAKLLSKLLNDYVYTTYGSYVPFNSFNIESRSGKAYYVKGEDYYNYTIMRSGGGNHSGTTTRPTAINPGTTTELRPWSYSATYNVTGTWYVASGTNISTLIAYRGCSR